VKKEMLGGQEAGKLESHEGGRGNLEVRMRSATSSVVSKWECFDFGMRIEGAERLA